MALMKFREQNQVKWVGVRPGHDGTQVAASNVASAGDAIVYTVPVGKVLYVTAWNAQAKDTAGGNAALFAVRDDLDAWVYSFMALSFAVAGQVVSSLSHDPPLEVPAGYDVYVYTDNAAAQIWATVFGWVE